MKDILDFINGEYVKNASGKTYEKRNPVDNSLIGMVHEAGKPEVDAGATIVTGGGIPDMPDELKDGCWVQPTIWSMPTATEDIGRAMRLASAIEVGLCWVNNWFLRALRTPFGGSKQSGIGREGGLHSLEFYTELRNVMVKY